MLGLKRSQGAEHQLMCWSDVGSGVATAMQEALIRLADYLDDELFLVRTPRSRSRFSTVVASPHPFTDPGQRPTGLVELHRLVDLLGRETHA